MKRTNEEQQPRSAMGPEMQRHQDRQAQRDERPDHKPIREQDEPRNKPTREKGEQDPPPGREKQAPGKDFDQPDERTERTAEPHTDTTNTDQDEEEFGMESASDTARS